MSVSAVTKFPDCENVQLTVRAAHRYLSKLTIGLALSGSIVSILLVARNPVPLHPLAYLWIGLIPVLLAAIPIVSPKRTDVAAIMLVLFVFAPFSLSIGALFIPAAAAMTLTHIVKQRESM